MVEVTRDLMRKRAEHNEMMLSTLEEVSLHQQDLKTMLHIQDHSRHLKILYLQNNLIEKMEGMTKLKELEYLNMAVNSVAKIEGLKRCESLNKLDLTLNFVDVEDLQESLEELDWCPMLDELTLTGNPCTDWDKYREYTIAKVPQIKRLDGEDVDKSTRLAAKLNLAENEENLAILAKASLEKKEFEKKEGKHDPDAWSRQNRWDYYQEEQERKRKQSEERKKNSMFKDYNDMMEEQEKNVSHNQAQPLTLHFSRKDHTASTTHKAMCDSATRASISTNSRRRTIRRNGSSSSKFLNSWTLHS